MDVDQDVIQKDGRCEDGTVVLVSVKIEIKDHSCHSTNDYVSGCGTIHLGIASEIADILHKENHDIEAEQCIREISQRAPGEMVVFMIPDNNMCPLGEEEQRKTDQPWDCQQQTASGETAGLRQQCQDHENQRIEGIQTSRQDGTQKAQFLESLGPPFQGEYCGLDQKKHNNRNGKLFHPLGKMRTHSEDYHEADQFIYHGVVFKKKLNDSHMFSQLVVILHYFLFFTSPILKLRC